MAHPLRPSPSLHHAGGIGITSRRVLHCDDVVAIGQFERVCFFIRNAKGGALLVDRALMERARAEVAHACPDGFGMLTIIESGMMPINPEQQRAVANALRSYGDQ